MSRFHGARTATGCDDESHLGEATGKFCDEMVHRVVACQAMATHDRHAGAILQQGVAMQSQRMVVEGLHHAGKTAGGAPRIPLDLVVTVDLQIERIGEGGGVLRIEALIELTGVVESFAKWLIRYVDSGHRKCLAEKIG